MSPACDGVELAREYGGRATQLSRAGLVAKRFPDWYFGQVVGAGHIAMLQAVDQLVPMIRSFLRSLG